MNRKEELLKLAGEEPTELVGKLIDEIIFLEKKLEELKKQPFLNVHPSNPSKQKSTPAAKMYKDFLQQYVNCVKAIDGVVYKNKKLEEKETQEESPLRKWMNENISERNMEEKKSHREKT